MTATQAYQVLNVSPGASLPEIERVYKAALQALQLQLVPGQPVDVRQKAQAQIAELKPAFEFLKNTPAPGTQPAWAGVQPQPQVRPAVVPQAQPSAIPRIPPVMTPPIPPAAIPQVQPWAAPQAQPTPAPYVQPFAGYGFHPLPLPSVPPAAGRPTQPPGMMPNPFGQGPAAPTYPWVMPAGFVLAAAVMLFVVVLCLCSTATRDRQKTAKLRVLSVPWCSVTVDGKSLGPSGQIDAFVLNPGAHQVVLRQGERVLSRTVHLAENSETVLKAQFEKEQTNVAYQRI